MKIISVLLLSVLLLSFVPNHLTLIFPESGTDKIDTALIQAATQHQQLNFIVLLTNQATLVGVEALSSKDQKTRFVFSSLRQIARESQKNLIRLLHDEAADYRSFYIANAIQSSGSLELIQKLASRPEVRKIIHNPWIKMEEPVDRSVVEWRGPEEIEWGLRKIKAEEVWKMGFEGENIVVGAQDTGVDWQHPALKEKYRGWNGSIADHNYNWHDAVEAINLLHGDSVITESNNPCGFNSPFPCDDGSHGTHTMGTIVGGTQENKIGVAPKAKWIACRNMERGFGTPATYIECFEWFLAPTDLRGENPDPTKAPHVINNSWSCPELEGCSAEILPLMQIVVNNLTKAGIVVVVSAGNDGGRGCATINTPAAIYEESFTIGATQADDSIASFSSRGPVLLDESHRLKPNVVAPGVNVRSSIPGGTYASFSGTSMAGPHVAGTIALMLSANPGLIGQVSSVERILEQTALPLTSDDTCGLVIPGSIPNTTYGFGRINAFQAVIKSLALSPERFEGHVRVYPNPFEAQANFELFNLSGEIELDLFNSSGQFIKSYHWSVTNYDIRTIDLPGWSPGVYFYRLRNENTIQSGSLLKR